MTWLEFLDKLLNTLNLIEVKGESNLDALLSCIIQTQQMRNALVGMNSEQGGGEENGRQTDIPTGTSESTD